MKHPYRWLGISESEADIYEMVSLNSPISEGLLLEKTGFRASYLSKILKSLLKKGIIVSSKRRAMSVYSAEPMRMLLACIDATVDAKLSGGAPEGIGGGEHRIRCFNDKHGGLTAVKEALRGRHKDGMVEITDVAAMFSVLSRSDLYPLRRIVRSRRVGVNGIYYQNAGSRRNHSFLESAYLPPEFKDFRSNVGVYGENLVLVTFDKKMRTIIIKDKWLAKTFRTLFAFALHSVESLQRQPKA